MEFKTDAQKACYERVTPMIKELFGEFVLVREDAPVFSLSYGSASTSVAVYPWGDDRATILSRAWVITGAEMTAALMEFLLKSNDDVRFGAFGIDSEKDIFFQQSIVGDSCDKEELRAAVMSVIMTADEYDDKIMSQFGGQRWADR